jgi:hypothetical protein
LSAVSTVFVEIVLVRFVNVVAYPPVMDDPVAGCTTQIHEHPKISYVLQVQWGVGWLGFIGSCVPVALPFRFNLKLDRTTVVRIGRMQMDLSCSASGYGGCAASQQFSFDVPSALAIKFVIVRTSSADCDKPPDASLQLRLDAGAQRTLEGARSSAKLDRRRLACACCRIDRKVRHDWQVIA